jgi:CheY-like chemotaxis protein
MYSTVEMAKRCGAVLSALESNPFAEPVLLQRTQAALNGDSSEGADAQLGEVVQRMGHESEAVQAHVQELRAILAAFTQQVGPIPSEDRRQRFKEFKSWMVLATTAGTAVRVRTVVVVDDELDTAITLGLLLKRMGYNVITTYDGKDGLRWVEGLYPDAVLLDLGMPGMDGFEVARAIRMSAWGKTVKLIAVTGRSGPKDRVRSKEAGFDLHLVKPVDKWSLVDALGPVGVIEHNPPTHPGTAER